MYILKLLVEFKSRSGDLKIEPCILVYKWY